MKNLLAVLWLSLSLMWFVLAMWLNRRAWPFKLPLPRWYGIGIEVLIIGFIAVHLYIAFG